MSVLDSVVEGLGRRVAARSTRRTFLARIGKVAVLVAGGPTLAALLVDRAEARVCGQSGVAPKCPTFDCIYPDSVWGWCWYSSAGCCAGGGLKKICDCCTLNWPFVHGYCPSGHNVRCIVESCYADPRVMNVPIERAMGLSAPAVALSISRGLPPGRGGSVVVGDADDHRLAAVAGTVAAVLDAPLLLSGRARLASSVIAEVQRLGATHATVVGALPTGHVDELRSYGLTVELLGGSADVSDISLLAAQWILDRTGGQRVMCIAPNGESAASAAAAAAAAGQLGMPLVVTVEAASQLTANVTFLVGPEATSRAGEVTGPVAVSGGTREEVALALASLVVGPEAQRSVTVHLAPAGAPDVSVGLAGARGVVLYHPDGALGSAFGWIADHQLALGRAVIGGTLGTLGDGGLYDLQSALNRFDTYKLIGVPGQGLPVFSQPREERELGRARAAGVVSEPKGSYWSSRANPRRKG